MLEVLLPFNKYKSSTVRCTIAAMEVSHGLEIL